MCDLWESEISSRDGQPSTWRTFSGDSAGQARVRPLLPHGNAILGRLRTDPVAPSLSRNHFGIFPKEFVRGELNQYPKKRLFSS